MDENLLILEDGLTHFYNISLYEMPHNGAARMGLHCLPMSHKYISHHSRQMFHTLLERMLEQLLERLTFVLGVWVGAPPRAAFFPLLSLQFASFSSIVSACPYSLNIGLSALTLYFSVQDK